VARFRNAVSAHDDFTFRFLIHFFLVNEPTRCLFRFILRRVRVRDDVLAPQKVVYVVIRDQSKSDHARCVMTRGKLVGLVVAGLVSCVACSLVTDLDGLTGGFQGDASSDAPLPPPTPPDGDSYDDGASQVKCDTVDCVGGEGCCINGADSSCAKLGRCSTGQLQAQCDDTKRCSPGSICCGEYEGCRGADSFRRTYCELADAAPSCLCGVQLCDPALANSCSAGLCTIYVTVVSRGRCE
jgi:hypothetical protein